jgi:hypothetical protein
MHALVHPGLERTKNTMELKNAYVVYSNRLMISTKLSVPIRLLKGKSTALIKEQSDVYGVFLFSELKRYHKSGLLPSLAQSRDRSFKKKFKNKLSHCYIKAL